MYRVVITNGYNFYNFMKEGESTLKKGENGDV